MNLKTVVAIAWFALLEGNSTALAEKAPLSLEALRAEADAIVVGRIEDVRVVAEDATFEQGFGNADWAIYLALRLESVEKGGVEGETLEARCFRIKSRRSMQASLTPSGHYPIPGEGTRVRAYLKQRSGAWEVVVPNGITDADEAGSGDSLSDAVEVTGLQRRTYTYLLPLEAWTLLAVVGVPSMFVLGWLRSRKRAVGQGIQVTDE